ncbi:MAG: hypothetical protein NUV47_03445 [Patescibacteria group bacterium]|nr:hypothetical protein [Patescibacteria group bacterium]
MSGRTREIWYWRTERNSLNVVGFLRVEIMNNLLEQISKKLDIKPNQNLIGLTIGLITVGVAEFFSLRYLFVFGSITTIIFLLSVESTTRSYTKNYCLNKMIEISDKKKVNNIL